MAENPYEASTEVTAVGSKPATGFVVTWSRIGVAASLTFLIIITASLLMTGTKTGQSWHTVAFALVVNSIGNAFALDAQLTQGVAFVVVFVTPYFVLTLIVFISLLRWLCRPGPTRDS